MCKIHELYREQTISTELDKAWEFIRTPRNLNRITPDDMSFEIVSDLPEEMYNGLLIEYRIGIPIIGKQIWLSELKHIRERHSFVETLGTVVVDSTFGWIVDSDSSWALVVN